MPSQLQLLTVPPPDSAQAELQIIPTLRGSGLTINLKFCAQQLESDCTVGHFSTNSLGSEAAQLAMEEHRSVGYPITLAPDVQAHFREYRDGAVAYASVMWQQDGQFYRVQFPTAERQNMLYMALEMANSSPLTGRANSSLTRQSDLSGFRGEGTSYTAVSPSVAPPLAATDAPHPPAPVDLATLQILESRVFSPSEIQQMLAQLQTTPVPSTVEDVLDRLTQEYLNRGYITSRAVLTDIPGSDQPAVGFVEGFLSDIEITGTQRVNESYIRSRLEQVEGPPLNLDILEERLRLLRVDPLFNNVEATLRPDPSGNPGGSILAVVVSEADPIVYGLSLNNESAPSIGAEQFRLNVAHFNLSGVGDRLSAGYSRSFAGGLSHFEAAYQVPISPTDGTLRFAGNVINTRVVESPFDRLGVQGSTSRYALWLRQPLIRRPQEELALSLGFTHTAGQTFLFDRLPTPFGFGPDADGFSRTSVIGFAQDYVYREPSGAWAFNSQFNFGTSLFDATTNDYPIPDGQFLSWQGLAQRVQRLGNNHLLIAQFNVQLTPDALLPSESFTIGGVNSVRGYRQGARSGDNGLRFSLEDRITVRRDGAGRPMVILSPFLDLGSVWNHPDNPNTILGQSFLMGSGLGLQLQNLPWLDGLSLKFDYGLPLVYSGDRGSNLQDYGFYFGINYNSNQRQ
ncbi:ShlB/FhaC/HecB family hemolysin secretion/activation protein [Nodosilinea sp. PGN35]